MHGPGRAVGTEVAPDEHHPQQRDRDVEPVHPPPGQPHVEFRHEQRGRVARRVGEDPVEADGHEQQPVKLLVERGPAERHHHHLAEAIDEPAQDEALQPDRRPAQQVAQGEPQQAQGDGVARADPGRQPQPREQAVQDADTVADLLPGHVVVIDVEAFPHGVVGE